MVTFSFTNENKPDNQLMSGILPEHHNYHHLISIMAASLLLGCAVDDSRVNVTQREILQPWTEVTGAQSGRLFQGLPGQPNTPVGTDFITLRRPTSISARGNDIYLLDAGLRRIFRYDSFQQTLTPFGATLPVNAGMSIYIAPDMTVYLTDPAHEQVLHFNWDGTPLPALISRGNMARPVSVVVNEHNGQILVADSLFGRVIAFDNQGMTHSLFKPKQIQSVAAMATGPDGIYVVDPLAKQVVVMSWTGVFRYAFGADALGEPGAIAVSRDNIVFISDDFDNTIKIYRRHKSKGNQPLLADTIHGNQMATGSFNGIGGMAAVDDQLYIADSLNSRVQIMLIDARAPDSSKIK